MKRYHGTLVPLVTPFDRHGKVDRLRLEKLIGFVTAHHCHPLALGTTGEAISMREEEKAAVVDAMAKFRGEGITLFACVSGTSLGAMIRRAKVFADRGAEVLVAHLPSYYKLGDAAMLRWYETFAEESPLPLMIYNIPATTHMTIPLEVVDRLSRHPKIVGLKDSERDEERLRASLELWKDREDFSHFTGWAARSFDALTGGSDGIIPSSGNVIPQIYDALYRAARDQDEQKGRLMQKISDEVGLLYQGGRLLGESLAALKVMLEALDLCTAFTLPPIYPLREEEAGKVRKQFLDYYENLKPLLNTVTSYVK
jgi:4-hydroxy-tetrahydrodipicolinate synthase